MDAKIGKGAFGEVFKGYEIESKEPVAVKVMEKKLMNQSPYLK